MVLCVGVVYFGDFVFFGGFVGWCFVGNYGCGWWVYYGVCDDLFVGYVDESCDWNIVVLDYFCYSFYYVVVCYYELYG